jgi:hypothetical protein
MEQQLDYKSPKKVTLNEQLVEMQRYYDKTCAYYHKKEQLKDEQLKSINLVKFIIVLAYVIAILTTHIIDTRIYPDVSNFEVLIWVEFIVFAIVWSGIHAKYNYLYKTNYIEVATGQFIFYAITLFDKDAYDIEEMRDMPNDEYIHTVAEIIDYMGHQMHNTDTISGDTLITKVMSEIVKINDKLED